MADERQAVREGGGVNRVGLLLDSAGFLWGLVLIPVAFLILLIGYPLLYNFVMSFQEVSLGTLARFDRPFVGLGNYVDLFNDPIFFKVLGNTVFFVVGNVACQLILGLAVAVYFNQRFPGAGYLRGLVLAGWMLPPLVIGALWKWMFATEFGVVNFLLGGLGLIADPIHWLSDPSRSLLSVTIANIWFGLPFNMILLSAGLANIPRDLYEAASLDGCGPVKTFFAVTLPLLRPTILAVVSLATIYTLRAFDLLWAMTKGGPVDSSNIFPLWSYQLSFDYFNFGAGAAVATMMFAIVFCVAYVYIRSIRGEAML